jgi:hypothetical protein
MWHRPFKSARCVCREFFIQIVDHRRSSAASEALAGHATVSGPDMSKLSDTGEFMFILAEMAIERERVHV